jgi:LysM repeat protein
MFYTVHIHDKERGFHKMSTYKKQTAGTVRRHVQIQRRIRSFVIACLMIAAFCSGFFGHTLLSAHAEVQSRDNLVPYYTSIQIQHDDTLWDLAQTYAQGSGYTVRQYVDELKRMNHLKSENIHAGEFLTVVYYAK